jgi:hypothetical protein
MRYLAAGLLLIAGAAAGVWLRTSHSPSRSSAPPVTAHRTSAAQPKFFDTPIAARLAPSTETDAPTSPVRQTAFFDSTEQLPPGVTYPEGVTPASGEAEFTPTEATTAVMPLSAPALFTPGGRPPAPIDDADESQFTPLPLTPDLSGWVVQDGKAEAWRIADEVIHCNRGNGGWLRTDREFSDFELRCEVQLAPGANTGIAFRFPDVGSPPATGIEVQLIDDAAEKYASLRDDQHTGSLYYLLPPLAFQSLSAGAWHNVRLLVSGSHLRIDIDGATVNDVDLDQLPAGEKPHPLRSRPISGYIGLQSSAGEVQFRRVRIRDLVQHGSSGVGTLDIATGTGDVCPPGGKVTVDYCGRFLDGREFDSSYDRGEPVTIALNDVIAGWQVGIPGMRVGGRRKLIVPAAMAYGDEGVKDLVPPGATLVFEVELRGVER